MQLWNASVHRSIVNLASKSRIVIVSVFNDSWFPGGKARDTRRCQVIFQFQEVRSILVSEIVDKPGKKIAQPSSMLIDSWCGHGFCAVQSRKTWRRVRQHGRDKGGKRATALRIIFSMDTLAACILEQNFNTFDSCLFFFFVLIRFKNYFI